MYVRHKTKMIKQKQMMKLTKELKQKVNKQPT